MVERAAYRGRVDLTLELPRSVLLALWLGGDGAGRDALNDAVQSDDEPHTVRYEPAGADPLRDDLTTQPFASLLDAVEPGPRDAATVLPAPGDLGATPARPCCCAPRTRAWWRCRWSNGSAPTSIRVTW